MANTTVEQMLEAGLHFGHQTFRWNPKMRPYIFDSRDGIHIIDLTKTHEQFSEAKDFVKQVASEGELLLLVGTKRQSRDIVEEISKAADLPHVSTHWPGGLLTNFQTIKGRIEHLKSLREKFANKDFGDMTKQEIGIMQKEMDRLEEAFGGVDKLDSLPGAIFIVDVVREKIALKEAMKLGIPIIAMVDTNGDPTNIDYVIAANDDAKNGIRLIVGGLVEAYSQGRTLAGKRKEKEAQEEAASAQEESADLLEQKEVKLAEAKSDEEASEAEKREKRATTKHKR